MPTWPIVVHASLASSSAATVAPSFLPHPASSSHLPPAPPRPCQQLSTPIVSLSCHPRTSPTLPSLSSCLCHHNIVTVVRASRNLTIICPTSPSRSCRRYPHASVTPRPCPVPPMPPCLAIIHPNWPLSPPPGPHRHAYTTLPSPTIIQLPTLHHKRTEIITLPINDTSHINTSNILIVYFLVIYGYYNIFLCKNIR
jgi:hypothetical protein